MRPSLLHRLFIWGIVVLALTVSFPNVLSENQRTQLPSFLPSQQVSLGLDLQGGAYLLLQAQLGEIRKEILQQAMGDIRLQLNKDGIKNASVVLNDSIITINTPRVSDFDAIIESLGKTTWKGSFNNRGNQIDFTLNDTVFAEAEKNAMARAIEIVRMRLDETGTKDLSIQRQGSSQILVQLPGIEDPEIIKRRLGKTAKLSFHMVNNDIGITTNKHLRLPASNMVLPYENQFIAVKRRALVTGDMLTDASATMQEGAWVVSFRFNSKGGRKFGQATSDNVGKLFAIVLDGEVISAPRINEPILGGSGIISGSFTAESSKDLALLLRSGALPVPLTIEEERTVGAGLGADSIESGKKAFIIGLIAVLVFMVLSYGLFGVFAGITLMINAASLIGLLTLIQANLTLPGIAGIVLTLGMAVDANILIYERMREEERSGKSLLQSIKNGYDQAFTTIMDANITTLIAGVILYFLGAGPIKGFAVTLSLGVLTTLFSAVLVSKLILGHWLNAKTRKSLPI